MSVVVSQVLPWTPQTLSLSTSSRWSKLAPLIRPSIKASTIPSTNQPILVDTSASSDEIGIVVVCDSEHVTEFLGLPGVVGTVVLEENKEDGTKGEVVVKAIKETGVERKAGFVVVRDGGRRFDGDGGGDVLSVRVDDVAELSHLVSLLGKVSKEERKSLQKTSELIKHFIRGAATTTTLFHEKKTGDLVSVVHDRENAAFETTQKAIVRDMTGLMKKMTKTAHDESNKMTISVHCADINGLSRLESYILTYEIAKYLEAQSAPHVITTSRITKPSLTTRGYTLSIVPIITTVLTATSKPTNPLNSQSTTVSSAAKANTGSKFPFPDAQVRTRITTGCNGLIREEPRITDYDTIVGDGDCGLTLRDGANKVLSFIEGKDLSNLPSVLADLVDELEVTMGGTSGALYCIFLSSLSGTLSSISSASELPGALEISLTHLLTYTRARKGDRTMLDALIPFIEVLKSSKGDVGKSMEEARKGVESTKKLEAKLGRSTYLDEKATRGVPDPGAVGVEVLLEGLTNPQ